MKLCQKKLSCGFVNEVIESKSFIESHARIHEEFKTFSPNTHKNPVIVD